MGSHIYNILFDSHINLLAGAVLDDRKREAKDDDEEFMCTKMKKESAHGNSGK